MKELVCIECGCVTAKLASGSSVRKGVITYCSKCFGDDFSEDNGSTYTPNKNDDSGLEMLKNMFGFK